MKIKSTFLLFLLAVISFNGNTENIDTSKEKIVETQSHSNSCGAMALSQLLNSVSDKKISESDVMNSIRLLTGNEKDDYSIGELENAAKKLGFEVETTKLPPDILPNLKQPVVILIGLNIKNFNHFVVLKGIKDGVAYLYDPTRKNVRLPYKDLIEQSINKEHPLFHILAVKGSPEKIKSSALYLSEIESERNKAHYTEEQANALTLATLSKNNQVIVDYSFNASLGNNKLNDLRIKSETFSHSLNARYGITDDIQIGGSIQHSDNTTNISFDNNKLSSNTSDRQYSLYATHGFKLNNSGNTNINIGLNGSYAEENDVFSGGFNIVGYQNTEFAQIILGGSFGKSFSHNQLADNSLPDYVYSGFIGANKPLGDRYLASVSFAVNDGKSKNKDEKFERSYSASTSLTYVFSKEFQISPSFTYSFGQMDVFSFGMNIAYVGGW